MAETERMHGKVFWSELVTRDVEAAKAFYAETCGWTYDSMPMENGTYHAAKSGDDAVAGIMDMNSLPHLEGVPAHWFTYIAVDDIGATVSASRAAGGNVVRDVFEVRGVGQIAIVSDSTGAVLGFIQPAPCD